ncbi:MAG: SGNH/GDSL hydrolase family protein [Planctomycetota bacterium]|nr:SGNH/GDSL hydrolase family protein [Planctomycetota bacterium]
MNRALWMMVLALCAPFASAAEYPPLVPPKDTAEYGKHIQRTMSLLATSTPEHRNTVRILFYGQSITAGTWHQRVEADLKARFPNADLVVENRAISGFASQLLVRTTLYDVIPFYPDLVVFHVYGSHQEYEALIKLIRSRTTSEVIMQSDHASKWPEPKAEGNFWQTQKEWEDKMNYFLLPEIAKKYRCAFQPQRWEWADYLKEHKLEPKDLLKDNVHPNEQGQWLMAELLKRFLIVLPNEPKDEWQDLVRTVEVGKDAAWKDGKLTVEFEGNRVLALAAPGEGGSAEVRIDGKKPSEFPGCYTITRPTTAPGGWFPAIKRVVWDKTPVLEEWTATCRNFDESCKDFEFDLSGSVTGADGKGRGKDKFASPSGRVMIEPQDWSFDYGKNMSKKKPPENFQVKWKVVPLYEDVYTAPKAADPARETATVLATGLPNGKHTLELIAKDGKPPALKALRFYKPPVQD